MVIIYIPLHFHIGVNNTDEFYITILLELSFIRTST